ncbi:MAG: response regulator [Desulfuromonadales bacterium]|nr:response regulator [Desulfuromonadales bacterium]
MAKILLVEDDPINLRRGTDLLQGMGHQVLQAKTGKEAASIIRKTLPDAILLDVILPDIEGFDLARKLKDHPRTQDIPIAYVTGRDTPEDYKKGFETGGKAYLVKPYTPLALSTVLNSLV